MNATEFSRNAETFSDRLQIAMADANLNQAELARALDTAWSTVDRWLKGSVPRKKMIIEIAGTLGVASRWLEDHHGPMKPDAERDVTLAKSLDRAKRVVDASEGRIEMVLLEIECRLFLMTTSEVLKTHQLLKECHTRLDEFGEWLKNLRDAGESK